MNGNSNQLEQTYTVALYRHLQYGWASILQIDHPARIDKLSDYVRISEPTTVRFSALASNEVIQNAVSTLKAAENAAYFECEQKIAQIRKQKANLLALTHEAQS